MTEYLDRPSVTLEVNHREATGYFGPWVLDLTYVDHMAGESDGLEIRLDNSDGRWMREWYPVKGTSIQATIGYEGGKFLSTGICQVDEIELSGPPDTVTIKALAAGNTRALRTPKSRAFEGKSLNAIAAEVAGIHGLSMVGEVPEISWRRSTQNRETDLGFLCRLGEEHGIVFSVKGDLLVFHELQKLEAGPKVLKLGPSDLTSYRFREKVVAGAASASYFDGSTKELVVAEFQLNESRHPDKKKIHRRTENKGQTRRLANMAMRTQKAFERDGTLALPGNTLLLAGGIFELESFGALDGLWMIRSARHSVSSSGYTTEMEARHVSN